MDSILNQEIAREGKDLTLLSYETKLKDTDFLLFCYTNASLFRNKYEGVDIPSFKDISSIFIDHCLQSSITEASIYITTPNGTYPLVEINKKPIDTTHPEITMQRIEQHLRIQTNQNYELINIKIQKYLLDNNMVFSTNGNLINHPIVEVW